MTPEAATMVRQRQQETKAFEIRPSGPTLDDDEDEENKLPSRWHLAIAAQQTFLIYLYYAIIIPTVHTYADSLDAPGGFAGGFAGVLVGATSVGAAVVQPLYRLLLKRSYAVTFLVQACLMLVGSIIYALAGLANTWTLLLVGRVLGGLGGSAYPVMTYLCEAVGKKHRSNATSIVIGISRSLGYALGPVFAAALVHVDFHMGELTIDKRNNPGFFVALLCVGQLVAVSWSFPREGSKLMDKKKTNERRLPSTSEAAAEDKSKREKAMHLLTLSWFVITVFFCPILICAWELSATKLLQGAFNWSIQSSALVIGGIILCTIVPLLLAGKLTYKFSDASIQRSCFAVSLVSCVGLFTYGSESDTSVWAQSLPYLICSFIMMNFVTAPMVLTYSHVTKICKLSEVEGMQNLLSVAGYLSRGVGAITGDLLSPNALAGLFMGLLSFVLVTNLLLGKRLLPKVS